MGDYYQILLQNADFFRRFDLHHHWEQKSPTNTIIAVFVKTRRYLNQIG